MSLEASDRRDARGRATRRGAPLRLALALLAGLAPAAAAQTGGIVSGSVVDERTLGPLAGAQVVAAGSGVGTLTDARGRFRLAGLAGGQVTLQVVLIGYRTQEQTVAVGATDVRIALTESAITLEQVVVTGTAGGAQKRAIGNAVVQVQASKVLESSPVQSVGQLLQGRAAGVFVYPSGGSVGKGARIDIRGLTSISLNSDPLIYVDGVRVDNSPVTGPNIQGGAEINRMNDINPEDIESIEVIKGPAASTLYGTEASNGVIQIITKKGRAGRPALDVSIRQGTQWFSDPEGRTPVNWALDATTRQPVSANLATLEKAAGRPIWTPGHIQGYTASLRGGSETLGYFVSADYDHERGIEPTNRFGRFSARANLSLAPAPAYQIDASFGLVNSRVELTGEEGASSTLWGINFGNPRTVSAARRGFAVAPPEVLWDVYDDMFQNTDRVTAGLQLRHRPAGWLRHRLTAGIDLTAESSQLIIERMPDEYVQFFGPQAAKGSKDIRNRDVSYTTFDYSATADARVGGLGLETSVGAQYYRRLTEFLTATGSEFPAPELRTTLATAIRLGEDDYIENSTVGVFVQQQLSWRNRLFLTGAVRADDNSAFGEDFDLVYYPKLSASWVVNEEPFWRLGAVNALKLRAAYGQSGQQPESFAALRTYRPITGPGDAPALSPRDFGNPALAPERGEEVELGFDAGLFADRLGIEFTYYRQTSNDVILLRDVAPSSGFPSRQFVNAGSLRNTGVELMLKALALDTRDVDVDFLVNLATNDNEILSLGGADFISTVQGGHRVGYPLGSFFFRRVVSATRGPTGAATDVMCDGGTGPNRLDPGGAPVPCAQAPRVYAGRNTPDLEGSVLAGVTLFGRLRVHGLVDFKRGQRKWDIDQWARCGVFRVCEVNVAPDRFDPVFVAEMQLTGDAQTGHTYTAADASFAKLREVSATYTVPERFARAVGASRATLTLAGRNLHTWAPNWTGMEPEDLVTRDLIAHLYKSQNHLPLPTQLLTTVNLTF